MKKIIPPNMQSDFIIKNANKYSTPYRVDLNSIMYSGAPDDDFHLLKGFLSYLEYLKISRNAL